MKRVAVFGTGYVGCVTAACLSRDGHRVIGVDIDAGKVAMIHDGKSPVAESGLGELVKAQVAAGMLSATTDLAAAVAETEIALIAVGTPSSRDGSVSTRAVEAVITDIGKAVHDSDKKYTVVLRSTLLPGILEDLLAPLLAEASGRELGSSLCLCNNPEFLRESTAIADYDSPPFVVVGKMETESHVDDVLALYATVEAEQIVTDTRSASLLKYACNAYHAAKITFANEIGSLAKSFGANGNDVMKLVCRDTKLNVSAAYLRPGFAFGGSCLPKDIRALTRHAERQALRLNLLPSLLPSNQQHLQRAVDMIEEAGCRKIGLAGLSFKAGTDDLRESPYVTLVETLIGRGYDFRIYDPGIAISRLTGRNLAYIDQHLPHLAALLVETPDELQQHAELLVLGTNVAGDLDRAVVASREVIDLRDCLVVVGQATQAAR